MFIVSLNKAKYIESNKDVKGVQLRLEYVFMLFIDDNNPIISLKLYFKKGMLKLSWS